MVNVYTESGDGQAHGEAGTSSYQQHEARRSMKVDAHDHKDQAGPQAAAAAAADCDASIGSMWSAGRDKSFPMVAGRARSPCKRTASPCKRAAAGSPAPAGAAAASDQGAVTAAGLQGPPDAAAAAAAAVACPQQQQPAQDGSSGVPSPSQQRPRGWLAMLPSPTQDGPETGNVFAPDAADQAAGFSSSLPQQQSMAATAHTAAPAAAAMPPSSISTGGPTGVRAPRPSPLLVSCDTPPPTSSRFSQGHASGSPQPQPGSVGHAAANRPPSGLQNRPAALQIQPPLSPLGAGCLTPSGLLSPNAMARPYRGLSMSLEDLDLEAIDGTEVTSNDDGVGGSSGSSPMVNTILRSGGLRSSRDHGDLRRTALLNQMLSPRPVPLSTPSSGPASLFTGETRALRVAPLPSSGGSTPLAAAGAAAAPAEGDAAASSAAASFNSTAEHLQQLLTSSVRNSRAPSAGATASPLSAGSMSHGSSILDRSSRSLPGTPAGQRHNNGAAAMVAAASSSSTASCAPPSSSRSSSMTASPVVPAPSHGGAAALLAGSVVASPRTPRSPLSVMFSPRAAGSASAPLHSSSSTPTALPPPLFGPGVVLAPASAGAGGSPSAGLSSSTALQQQQQHGAGRGVFVFPAGSRLSAASPTLGMSAAPAAPQQHQGSAEQHHAAQAQEQAQEHGAGGSELEGAGEAASCLGGVAASVPLQPQARPPWQQQQQQQPEHLPQLLRQQLQLHDTRLGPHGESPLSPSHHSALLQQQHRGEGGLRSSPTRPTPLVPPALVAAAAAAHDVRRADAAAGAAAAADAAAAAACEVEDVGQRNDVHEWLDQHSWPFVYELPMHLRDAAEFARGGSSSNGDTGYASVSIMPPREAVSVTAAGPYGGSPPQGSSSNSGGAGSNSNYAGLQHRQPLAGNVEDSPAGSDSQVVQLEQLRDFATRLDRFRLRTATECEAGASSAAESAGFDDSCQESPAGGNAHGCAAASSASIGTEQVCSTTPQYRSECSSTAAAAARDSNVHVLASGRAEAVLAMPAAAAAGCDILSPGWTAAGQSPGLPAPAFSGLGTMEAAQQQPSDCAVRADNSAGRQSGRPGSSSSSSSGRLLSPGSHRYPARSPVAEDSCCYTCAPAVEALVGATETESVGPAVGRGSSSGAAAAADEGVAVVSVAVEEAGMQLSPAQSSQQQLHGAMMPAAALPVQDRQRQRQMAVQLQQEEQAGAAAAAAAACAGAIADADGSVSAARSEIHAAAAPLPAGCCDGAEGPPVAADPVITAASAAAEGACWDEAPGVGRATSSGGAPAASIAALLHDGAYVAELLASLPGVDACSAHVQHALRQLQGGHVDDDLAGAQWSKQSKQ